MELFLLAIATIVVTGFSNVLLAYIIIRGIKNEPLMPPGEHNIVQADINETLDETNPEANGWLPQDQHYV